MPLEHIIINLKRELIRTFAVVDEWFDTGPPLQCYKPLAGGWCVNEVLEHIMLTNHFLLIIIEKAATKALQKRELVPGNLFFWPENYSLHNSALHEVADPTAFAWQRPEHHQPSGNQALWEVRQELRNHLDQCLITLELLPNGEGTLHHTTMSVNNLGKLDVYQYVYFLALHAQRHLRQMEKIRAEFEQLENNVLKH